MAKEEKTAKHEGAKPKRKHLKGIYTEQAHDGTLVHHHTYQRDRNDPNTIEPQRGPMATSSSPEEAGQHVAEQFGMNDMGGGGGGEEQGDQAEAQPAM
jgi:hypothetical protein